LLWWLLKEGRNEFVSALMQLSLAENQDFPIRRKHRSLSARPFRMTERDMRVIDSVHRYRVLDRNQVERLYFASPGMNTNQAIERLKFLYEHGYLERLYRPQYPPQVQSIHLANTRRGPVYRLAAGGAKLLAEERGLPMRQFNYWRNSDDRDSQRSLITDQFIEHMVTLADIRIAVEHAAIVAGGTIEIWRDEVELRRMQTWDTIVVEPAPKSKSCVKVTPDGYFVLTTAGGQRGYFFIEADRGTESIKERWRQKLLGYKGMLSTGIFHKRYGAHPGTAFRVLVTTPTIWRAQNIHAATTRYGAAELASLFLCAPISDVTSKDALRAPIWLRGGTTGAQALL
jgi:hypothetical protein